MNIVTTQYLQSEVTTLSKFKHNSQNVSLRYSMQKRVYMTATSNLLSLSVADEHCRADRLVASKCFGLAVTLAYAFILLRSTLE